MNSAVREDPNLARTRTEYSLVSPSSLDTETYKRYRWHKENLSSHTCPYCKRDHCLEMRSSIVKEQERDTMKNGQRKKGSCRYYVHFRCRKAHGDDYEIGTGLSTKELHARLDAAAWKIVDRCRYHHDHHRLFGLWKKNHY